MSSKFHVGNRALSLAAVLTFFLVATLLALSSSAFAQSEGPIHVAGIKARPTAPGATTAVVYMIVMNHGAVADDLKSLSTPVAETAEMHRTVNEGGVMRMDAVPDLPIEAYGGVTFGPDGLHVMLMGLKQPLKLGDTFPLTLNFAKAGPITVTVKVAAIKPGAKPEHDMSQMKH